MNVDLLNSKTQWQTLSSTGLRLGQFDGKCYTMNANRRNAGSVNHDGTTS
jgi:hypothetical protein